VSAACAITLPHGLWDGRRRRSEAELRLPTGADEAHLLSARNRSRAEQVTGLLARCVARVDDLGLAGPGDQHPRLGRAGLAGMGADLDRAGLRIGSSVAVGGGGFVSTPASPLMPCRRRAAAANESVRKRVDAPSPRTRQSSTPSDSWNRCGVIRSRDRRAR